MNKKTLSLILVLLLIIPVISVSPVTAEENSKKSSTEWIKPLINIEIENSTEDLITPAEPYEATIKVTCELQMSNLSQFFFLKTRIGRLLVFGPEYFFLLKGIPGPLTINFSIDEDETWFDATIDAPTQVVFLNNEKQEFKINVAIAISEDAPGLQMRKVTLKADILTDYRGIANASRTLDLVFTPDFLPWVSVSAEKTSYSIPPLNTTSIPINISNHANHDAKFNFYIKGNISKNINVTLLPKDPVLEIGEDSYTTYLHVTPDKNFEKENISIDVYVKPFPIGSEEIFIDSLNFELKNDGSLKDEDKLEIDITLLIILLTVILLVFIAIIFFIRRKNKE